MYFRLENEESQKAQEIGNLIRAYNRSKREEAESEPLNIYVEDEKGNLLAGLVAETFGNWLEIEYLFVKEELRGQGIGSKLSFCFCQYLPVPGTRLLSEAWLQGSLCFARLSLHRTKILLPKGFVR